MKAARPPLGDLARNALVDAIVGLFIALIAVTVVFMTPLRTVTSDLSQRLLLTAGLSGGALGDVHGPASGPAPPSGWFFVDLGPRLCAAEGGGALCPPNAPRTDRDQLAKVIAAVRAQNPRLVILDVRTSAEDETSGAFRQAILAPGSPVLLSWAPYTKVEPKGDGRSVLVTREGDAMALGPGASHVRYFPALKRMSGPAARLLTPDYQVVGPDGRSRRAPGIAYAAAAVAQAPHGRPWEELDPPSAVPGGGHRSDCTARMSQSCLDAFRATERVFSFPPVREAALPISSAAVRFGHLTPGQDTQRLTAELRDGVVIIGDSRSGAGDRTWTAVGEVSGAEIILNDVRQYLLAPPSPPAGFVAVLLQEAPILLAGAVSLFVVHALFGWAWPVVPGVGPAGTRTLARDAWRASCRLAVVLLVTALAITPIILFGHSHPGSVLNFVAPYLAISLENAFELVHKVALFLHESLHRLLAHRRTETSTPQPEPGT